MLIVRIILLYTLILLGEPLLFAQKAPLIFNEQFNNNDNNWSSSKGEKMETKINNGNFYINRLKGSSRWCFWNSPTNNRFFENHNFEIETSIQQYKGKNSFGYGLIWGVKDVKNYNAFIISNTGYVSIRRYQNNKGTSIHKWFKAPNAHIDSLGYNKLTIKKRGSALLFYVNDSLVTSSKNLSFAGSKVGFTVTGNNSLKVNYIKVRQKVDINLIPNAIRGLKKENLGTAINSKYDEIMPVVSQDASMILFTRDDHPENLGEKNKNDVWISTRTDRGEWSKAHPLGPPINNTSHNQVISISADNNTLLVGNTYHPDGRSAGSGVSISHKKADGTWEVPKTITIKNYDNQSSKHSFYLAPNNQVLLLSGKHKKNYGNRDLYVCFRENDSTFSEPMNLGSDINTSFHEGTPFLAADGKTLYFYSFGHPGYGSADIFVSKRIDDSWQNWTTPQNLGPEINTPQWDAYYHITADAKLTYWVSSDKKQSYGETDIFAIEVHEEAKPDPVLMVKGQVFNAKTKEAIDAKIMYFELTSNKQEGSARSNHRTGNYQIILPYDNSYSFMANKAGYYPISDYIVVGKINDYTEIKRNLYLHPIEEGEKIELNNIFFSKKNQNLKPEAEPELNRLISVMKKHPNMTITLGAPDKDNKKAKQKTQILINFLISKGVDKNRLKIDAHKPKEKKAYFVISSLSGAKDTERQGDFTGNIKSEELKVGHTFRLNKLYFPADKSYVTKISERSLDELADFLQKNPTIRIEIGGHTNGLPAHSYCDKLSNERAEFIKNFLVKKGIKANRLTAKGYGKRQAIASNETPSGRLKNQRVEIKVTKL